jgi:hypothetical protein
MSAAWRLHASASSAAAADQSALRNFAMRSAVSEDGRAPNREVT